MVQTARWAINKSGQT